MIIVQDLLKTPNNGRRHQYGSVLKLLRYTCIFSFIIMNLYEKEELFLFCSSENSFTGFCHLILVMLEHPLQSNISTTGLGLRKHRTYFIGLLCRIRARGKLTAFKIQKLYIKISKLPSDPGRLQNFKTEDFAENIPGMVELSKRLII